MSVDCYLPVYDPHTVEIFQGQNQLCSQQPAHWGGVPGKEQNICPGILGITMISFKDLSGVGFVL